MKIKILGTRGEIEPTAPYHHRHSGILIDDKILIDVGEKEFLSCNPICILITHLHPDHAYFVRFDEPISVDVPIYAPENYKNYPIKVLSKSIKVGGYTITPIPTQHSLKVKSQAYLIEKGNQRVLYTGDLYWITNEHQQMLKQVTLVVTEASFIRDGGMIRRHKGGQPFGHAGVPDLVRFFKPYTSTVLFMHFGSWFYKLGATKARKQLNHFGKMYGMTVLVGYDGMVVDVNDLKRKLL